MQGESDGKAKVFLLHRWREGVMKREEDKGHKKTRTKEGKELSMTAIRVRQGG